MRRSWKWSGSIFLPNTFINQRGFSKPKSFWRSATFKGTGYAGKQGRRWEEEGQREPFMECFSGSRPHTRHLYFQDLMPAEATSLLSTHGHIGLEHLWLAKCLSESMAELESRPVSSWIPQTNDFSITSIHFPAQLGDSVTWPALVLLSSNLRTHLEAFLVSAVLNGSLQMFIYRGLINFAICKYWTKGKLAFSE